MSENTANSKAEQTAAPKQETNNNNNNSKNNNKKNNNNNNNNNNNKRKKGRKQCTIQCPKGTRDYGPPEMALREKVLNIISCTFKKFGAERIETPVFELKDTLTNKYGEDSKLIYDLADQGGQICSLRYDLTVPFARYCAQNRIKQMKRYHIARVYRRDQPAMNRGRYREFYQCDFDIAGQYDKMIPDAECLCLMANCLKSLDLGNFNIKINHRLLLDGMMAICGVPADKFRAICSAIDKLDKTPWEEVKNEMVNEKGLDEAVADKIKVWVDVKGKPNEVITLLKEKNMCEDNESANTGLQELELLFSYLEALGVIDNCSFDLSLARGLDYYTGMIVEAVLVRCPYMKRGQSVGSVCGGGRYDTLIGMLGGEAVPCVGFSIGLERIFTIYEAKMKKLKTEVRPCETEVYVATPDNSETMILERMKLCTLLRDNGIKAEYLLKKCPRIKPQLNSASSKQVPLAAIIGTDEISKGFVTVKDLNASDDSNDKQIEVKREDIVAEILKKLGRE